MSGAGRQRQRFPNKEDTDPAASYSRISFAEMRPASPRYRQADPRADLRTVGGGGGRRQGWTAPMGGDRLPDLFRCNNRNSGRWPSAARNSHRRMKRRDSRSAESNRSRRSNILMPEFPSPGRTYILRIRMWRPERAGLASPICNLMVRRIGSCSCAWSCSPSPEPWPASGGGASCGVHSPAYFQRRRQ